LQFYAVSSATQKPNQFSFCCAAPPAELTLVPNTCKLQTKKYPAFAGLVTIVVDIVVLNKGYKVFALSSFGSKRIDSFVSWFLKRPLRGVFLI
jgi:hypothetical protein